MSHNFQKSLAIGKKGEEEFFKLYSKELKLILQGGFIEDFTMGKDKEMVELKTDSYDPNNTPNFFMEYYSDTEKEKLGGPWRALEKGINHFIYWFPKTKEYWLFHTQALVLELNKLIKDLKPIKVYNSGWITTGYKILRSDLEHLNKRKKKK